MAAPASARIPRHVEHGREGPAYAGRRGFDCGDAGPLLHYLRVEGRRLAERYGEDGVEAVDHVAADQYWYAEAALLHGGLLHDVDFVGVHAVQDGSHLSGCRGLGEVRASGELVHLADLFLQRHLGKQAVDLSVDFALVRAPGAQAAGDEQRRENHVEADSFQVHVVSAWNLSPSQS